MKQKLGFLCTVLLLSCLLAAPSFAEDAEEKVPVGTRLGSVYTTDIVTYIDGAPIASYNIGRIRLSGGVGPGDPVGNGHVGPAAGAHAGA